VSNKNLDTSTKDPTSHAFSVMRYVVWLVAEKRPLLFIGVPGFVLVILGLLFGILTLQYYNQTHVFLIPYAISLCYPCKRFFNHWRIRDVYGFDVKCSAQYT